MGKIIWKSSSGEWQTFDGQFAEFAIERRLTKKMPLVDGISFQKVTSESGIDASDSNVWADGSSEDAVGSLQSSTRFFIPSSMLDEFHSFYRT